ncbi:MAG TPA: hypothetical protein VK348_00825 [Planctomycetota bacterium]|nr:hypothetical protein [Planctomycetota bacterium]
MQSRLCALAAGVLLAWARPAVAQDDRVVLVTGEAIERIKVLGFDVRELRYQRDADAETITADRVARLELGRAAARHPGGADLEPGALLAAARRQLEEKDVLAAQVGLLAAAELWLQHGSAAGEQRAVAVLDELRTRLPQAGTVIAALRLQIDLGLGQGPAGVARALGIARRLLADAVAGHWAPGCGLEGEYQVLRAAAADGSIGALDLQDRLRELLVRATAARAGPIDAVRTLLADSLRRSSDLAAARSLYQQVVDADLAAVDARAAAHLGLGQLQEAAGSARDREPYRAAMLQFLRAHLACRMARRDQHAEALYHAMQAAEQWQGDYWQEVHGRCRGLLLRDYATSAWAARVRGG